MIEGGKFLCAGHVSTLRVKIEAVSTGVHGVLWWNLDYRTRQFLMCCLRVKIKAENTGVRSVLSWSLDDRTREFIMCLLCVYAWLRVKIKKSEK